MLTSFNPVRLSNAENEFLLKWLGQPSIVALRDTKPAINPRAAEKDKNPVYYPDGVIPASVKPILDGVIELIELEKVGQLFVGVEAMKNAIRVWQKMNAKWTADYKRSKNAPRWPSLYSYDAKGRPHWGGPGSDSGEVRTYFGPAGERIPFTIQLQPDTLQEWQGPSTENVNTDPLLFVDANSNRIECKVRVGTGICGHTESYKDGSRASYNAARARMSKHLRKTTLEVEAHRELHTNEFGSGLAS